MSKFGIGVGDDFPVDDGRGNEPGGDQGQPQDDRAEFEAWKQRRDAYRAQRDQWRRQHDEWRDRKRAFKERIRAAVHDSFGRDSQNYESWRRNQSGYRSHRFPFVFWPVFGLMIPILVIALFIALIAAVFKSPFVFLGLGALAVAFFAWRHEHHPHHRFDGPYYDFDLKPSGGPQPPPSSGPVVTPPPSPPSGK